MSAMLRRRMGGSPAARSESGARRSCAWRMQCRAAMAGQRWEGWPRARAGARGAGAQAALARVTDPAGGAAAACRGAHGLRMHRSGGGGGIGRDLLGIRRCVMTTHEGRGVRECACWAWLARLYAQLRNVGPPAARLGGDQAEERAPCNTNAPPITWGCSCGFGVTPRLLLRA